MQTRGTFSDLGPAAQLPSLTHFTVGEIEVQGG